MEALAAGAAHLDGVRSFKALVLSARPGASPPDARELQRSRDAAHAFLTRPGALRATWELQRWGVAEHTEPLGSRWFQEGLVLQCLHEAGLDQGARIQALLAELPHELRWYAPLDPDGRPTLERGFWHGIPPDSDSLGLVLQLAATAGGLDPDRAQAWIAYLVASLEPDGRIPTWFYTAPDGGPSIEGPQWEYASNDCATARVTVLTGLLRYPDGGPEPALRERILTDNARIVDQSFRSGAGDFYYSAAFSELCFVRLVQAWRTLRPGDPLARQLEGTAATLVDAMLDSQAGDGGWGDPLATACRLEALARWGRGGNAQQRARRYLVERQRPDGAWPPAPFYLMPGKTLAHIQYHSGFEYTTALSLRALAASCTAGPVP